MAVYSLDVDFVFSTTVQIEADSPEMASAIFMGADQDQIAHVQGKSFATVAESVRSVTAVTEVV